MTKFYVGSISAIAAYTDVIDAIIHERLEDIGVQKDAAGNLLSITGDAGAVARLLTHLKWDEAMMSDTKPEFAPAT